MCVFMCVYIYIYIVCIYKIMCVYVYMLCVHICNVAAAAPPPRATPSAHINAHTNIHTLISTHTRAHYCSLSRAHRLSPRATGWLRLVASLEL